MMSVKTLLALSAFSALAAALVTGSTHESVSSDLDDFERIFGTNFGHSHGPEQNSFGGGQQNFPPPQQQQQQQQGPPPFQQQPPFFGGSQTPSQFFDGHQSNQQFNNGGPFAQPQPNAPFARPPQSNGPFTAQSNGPFTSQSNGPPASASNDHLASQQPSGQQQSNGPFAQQPNGPFDQHSTGQFPQQQSNGPFAQQPNNGPFPQQASGPFAQDSNGPFAPHQSNGQFAPQQQNGPFAPQQASGPFAPQQGSGPFAPPHANGPFAPQQSNNGPFAPQQSNNGPFAPQQSNNGPFAPQQSNNGPFAPQQPFAPHPSNGPFAAQPNGPFGPQLPLYPHPNGPFQEGPHREPQNQQQFEDTEPSDNWSKGDNDNDNTDSDHSHSFADEGSPFMHDASSNPGMSHTHADGTEHSHEGGNMFHKHGPLSQSEVEQALKGSSSYKDNNGGSNNYDEGQREDEKYEPERSQGAKEHVSDSCIKIPKFQMVPIEDKLVYVSWRDRDLHPRDRQLSWNAADSFCRDRCMNLVAVESSRLHSFIAQEVKSGSIYGAWTSGRLCPGKKTCDPHGKYKNYLDLWQWTSSGNSVGDHWSRQGGLGERQPDNLNERIGNGWSVDNYGKKVKKPGHREECLAVLNNWYGDGPAWHDLVCLERLPFVCEAENKEYKKRRNDYQSNEKNQSSSQKKRPYKSSRPPFRRPSPLRRPYGPLFNRFH